VELAGRPGELATLVETRPFVTGCGLFVAGRDPVPCDFAPYDFAPYDSARYDFARYDFAPYDFAVHDLVLHSSRPAMHAVMKHASEPPSIARKPIFARSVCLCGTRLPIPPI